MMLMSKGVGRLKIRIIICIVLLNISCSRHEPSSLIKYVLMLKPEMKSDEVKLLLPSDFFFYEGLTGYSSVDFMDCRYSSKLIHKLLQYVDSEKGESVIIYFDINDKLIGFDYSSSSGPELKKEDCSYKNIQK